MAKKSKRTKQGSSAREFDLRFRRLTLECLEARTLLSASTINWATQQQTISGFGASSAWITGNVDSSQQQLLWSPTNGGGISVLRSHINPDTGSSSGEIGTMQKAQAMGVTIFSTPWSPPAAWKSNNNIADIVNGVDTQGYLLSSHYQDYANWLKQYIINMANSGITIYAVSMQNEANWSADYESCRWSAQQFFDVLPILHDTLAGDSRTANVKIILPEEIHWNNLDLVSQVMGSTENAYTNLIYADHTYGITTVNNSTYPGKDGFTPMSNLYNLNGHQMWETEHTGDDPIQGITAGLNEAQSIYDIVYIAQASAYNHWWINSGGGAGLLGGNWQSTKLFSAMEQYSKFIRPGWTAIGESDDNNGLRIGAFKNTTSGDFAMVVVNSGSSPITETFTLNGAYSPVLTPWVTSATLDVAQQQSLPTTGNGSSFSYTIPAQSIVTLTGNATATPVTQAPAGLLATAATTSSIALSWTNNVTSATGYTMQRSSDGLTWTTLTSGLSSSTFTYTDSSGLVANTLYYYRVLANNGTLYSNVVSMMTQPPAPTNLTASYNASNQNVTLNWTSNGSSSTDYAVDVSLDGGTTWTTQTAGIASGSTSYTDSKAPDMVGAVYRVRAVYGANSSAPTNSVTLNTTVVKAPSGITAKLNSNGRAIDLAWTMNTWPRFGASGTTLSIERSTDGTTWTVIGSVAYSASNYSSPTYTDSTTAEGKTYYYRIRNYDVSATPSTYSAYATAAAVTVPPTAPTHVDVFFSPLPTLTARVLWVNNSTSDTAYEADRSADGGTTWTTLTNTLPANSTSYTDSTVTSGQTYEYRVATLSNGLASASVATLSETASALPSPYAHGDIGDSGTVGLAGSASYNSSTSTYTLSGAGADIWNTADGFQFSYTTLTGDGSYVAQVMSMANFAAYGKAGIMLRGSLDPSSAFIDDFWSQQGAAATEYRTAYNASAAGPPYHYATYTSLWLKLTRSGNLVTAYYGTNGTTWSTAGSVTFASGVLGTTVYVGMITCAHSSSQSATATITNAALTGTGNQAPTVATAAAASPSPATGATANLSVLGADDGGEGNLIYSWATSGSPPAPVVFSSNGQNGSKNTVATFNTAGSYSFVVTITDQFGLLTTSTVNLTVNQTVISMVVSPGGATLAPNSQKQFSVTAYDQFGTLVSNPPGIAWSNSNSNLGSINTATGLYSAGALQGNTTVTAASGPVIASSTVNVTTLPAPLAWYSMDAASGPTLTDSSGQAYNGAATGSYSWATGEASNAMTLSGGYATLPSTFAAPLQSTTNFAISGWVNLTSINHWARLFDFGTGTNVYMFLAPADGNGYVRFAITTGGGGGEKQLTTTTALATNTWTFLAVTLSGTTGKLYINGAVAATNSAMTLNPSSLGNTTQDYLGKSQFSSDPTLQGSIDDVRIYNAGLSGTQVAQLYDSYFPPTISTAAANPATVTATTSALSVQGTSSVNLPLTYTWAAIGTPPAPVTFSVNGSNAAKSTTATFTKAGTYTLGVTTADTYGQFATSTVTLNVQQTLTSLAVSPSSADITGGSSQQFAATANDQFNQPMLSQPPVTWTLVSGQGNATSGGLYTPPFASGSATVQASAGSLVKTAAVSYNTQAQWNAAASSSWNGASWKDVLTSATIAAPGTRGILGDMLTFTSALGPIARLDGANPTLAAITFNNVATSYTIAQGSGGSLTLQGSGGATVSVLAGSHAISAPMHLASNTTFNAAAASTLTMSGPIDGSGSLTKTGGGTFVLDLANSANSFRGGLIVQAGTVRVNAVNAIPNGSSVSIGAGGSLIIGAGNSSSPPSIAAASSVSAVLPASAASNPVVAQAPAPSAASQPDIHYGIGNSAGSQSGDSRFPKAAGLPVGIFGPAPAAVARVFAALPPGWRWTRTF